MNRNPYRETAGDVPSSSQVAAWARNWAEAFRREAWQQTQLDAAMALNLPDPIIKPENHPDITANAE